MGEHAVPKFEERGIRLPKSLATFAWGLPLLWLLSLLKIAIERLSRNNPEPWVLPQKFDDFICYWFRLPLLHSEAFFTAPDNGQNGSGWGYPAPPIWIYRFFYLFDPRHAHKPLRGFALMAIVGVGLTAFCAYRLNRSLQRRGLSKVAAIGLTASAFLFSWPLLFVLQRGNIELLLWLPLVAAIYAFARRRWMLAAVLIGLTASFKLYPIILFALFLRERRFGAITVGICVAVCMTLLSLWYVGPTFGIAWSHIGFGVSGFVEGHGAHIDWSKEGYNHSLFHLIKVNASGYKDQLGRFITPYVLCIGLLMTALFFLRIIRMPKPNQVMILVISMIFLPPTSYDYTLQVLFIPWAWLALIAVSRARRGEQAHGILAAMILFALVLGPELFITSHRYLYSGTLKAVCLLLLIGVATVFRFDDPDLGANIPAVI